MSVYKPDDIRIDDESTAQLRLILYFDHIDDKYLSNPNSVDLFRNKEKNLENQIRYDIESFFNIKTDGLDLLKTGSTIISYSPYIHSYLSIKVISDREKKF